MSDNIIINAKKWGFGIAVIGMFSSSLYTVAIVSRSAEATSALIRQNSRDIDRHEEAIKSLNGTVWRHDVQLGSLLREGHP